MKRGFFNSTPTPPDFCAYETFSELTQNLTKEQIKTLDDGISTYKNLMDLTSVAKLIRTRCWDEIVKIENFPYLALAALKEGHINGMEFSTSQIFYNVYTHADNRGKVQIIAIFEKNQLNSQAKDMIDDTMQLKSASSYAYYQKELLRQTTEEKRLVAEKRLKTLSQLEGKIDWNKGEESKFYEILKRLPPSEHAFLIISDDDFALAIENSTVTLKINFSLNENVFSRFMLDKKPMMMIPSKGMMQAYIEATRGKQALTLTSRFGLSSWNDLLKGMKGKQTKQGKMRSRDLCITFLPLGEVNPITADGLPAPTRTAEVEKHDGVYHAIRFADVPSQHIDLFAEIAEFFLLQENVLESKSAQLLASALRKNYAQAIIDMEHSAYDRHNKESLSFDSMTEPQNFVQFWASLNRVFDKAKFIFSQEHKGIDVDILMTNLSEEVGSFLIKNENSWNFKYKFTLASLGNYIKNEKDLLHKKYLPITHNYIRAKILAIEQFSFVELGNFACSNEVCLFFRTKAKEEISLRVRGNINAAINAYINTYSASLIKAISNDLITYFTDHIKPESIISYVLSNYKSKLEIIFQKIQMCDYERLLKSAILHNQETLLYLIINCNRKKITDDFVGNSLLQYALQAGNYHLVTFLLRKGALLSQNTDTFKKAGDCAASTGRYDLLIAVIYTKMYGVEWEEKQPEVTVKLERYNQLFLARNNLSSSQKEELAISTVDLQNLVSSLGSENSEKESTIENKYNKHLISVANFFEKCEMSPTKKAELINDGFKYMGDLKHWACSENGSIMQGNPPPSLSTPFPRSNRKL